MPSSLRERPRLLIVEPYPSGHRPNYLRQLLAAWPEGPRGRVVAAVSPRLLEGDPRLRDLAFEEGEREVEFVEMPEALALPDASPVQLGIRNWTLLRRYVEELRPEQVLHMSFEHLQPGLAFGGRFSYPVRLSGLAFRVSHHHPLHVTESPVGGRLRRLRKRTLLRHALRNRHVHALFSSDPSVAAEVERLAPNARGVVLPDPVVVPRPSEAPAAVRAHYGVEAGRQVLLLFGMLSERKGALVLLEALRHLPADAARRLCVILAGPTSDDLRERLPEAVERVRAERPELQLLRHDAFLHDPEVQALYLASDLVLVPYLRHVGTSSVLIRAAAAGRPVLGSDYSTMGIWIDQYRLGQAVDTAEPGAIAKGILTFLQNPDVGFEAARAMALSEANNPEAYARVVFHHLGLAPTPAPSAS